MKQTVDGREVSVVRDAKQGDPGFDSAHPGTQKLVKFADDGSERIVPANTIAKTS